MTPNFAVVGFETPAWHLPRLWLPLFLLWIPALLLSPLILLALVTLAFVLRTTIWRLLAIFWGILTSLPGTDVYVRAEGNQVLVRIL
jgi:hypothetical protein